MFAHLAPPVARLAIRLLLAATAALPAQQATKSLQTRVWVNRTTGIYHCPASRYYGVGEKGEYMKEAQARAGGFHAASQRGCDADGDARRVWVNDASRVYHCPGSSRYAATKTGRYMSEAAAVADGYRPAGGRKCP